MVTISKLNESNMLQLRIEQLVLTGLHWQWFAERAPACSILSCHFHTVCSLRFQPSHCVLLNPSIQIDPAWRIATVSLPVLQHVGSIGLGGAPGLHRRVAPGEYEAVFHGGMAPGEDKAVGGHIGCHYFHYTWERKSYKEIWQTLP